VYLVTISIQLFARAREEAGVPTLQLDVPTGTTVSQMRGRLAKLYPQLQAILKVSCLAVNSEIADETRIIEVTDEVALLPPVSGG
jgi:molybdopterin converting factor subunit 1